ncbi:MAG: aliphatic sulfonate ABC transporter substrate-binding protein [Alphaproteobacteria bacterium]|nr:aliphatic sulfonate ABC transporter substrate-binding protein [Alphaproteobacteria bacterium]
MSTTLSARSPRKATRLPGFNLRSALKAVAAVGFAIGTTLALAGFTDAHAADAPDRITVDYAYYNPVALLLKKKGWVEEEFAKDDIKIRWVLSLGSNKALEFLRGRSTDFGSTAGSAAVVARAGGLPIKSVYVYSKPEWTALVTTKDSDIRTVADLKGKRVAVTRGTDPHIFLLRALDEAGLTEKDIKPVLLQHPDGYRALVGGQVDAWAGLDPHMAKGELESGTPLFYRNADLNTYGILNVREEFAAKHPDIIERVLKVYEKGRKFALANPDELRAVLVEAVKLTDDVAQKQLGERTDITNPVIGQAHRETFVATGEVLKKIGVIKPDVDVKRTVNDLIDTSFLEQVSASN